MSVAVLASSALLAIALAPGSARADRGAFTVEAGGGGAAVLVPAPWARPRVFTPSFAPLVAADLRYALSHSLELALGGFFEPTVTVFHAGATVPTENGAFVGTLRHQLTRFGASAGARLVVGMVVRWSVGLSVGWSRRSCTGFQHIALNDGAPLDYGLALPSFDLDDVVVAPSFGVEWAAGDHWSLSLAPQLQVVVGAEASVAFQLPLKISWSWYL